MAHSRSALKRWRQSLQRRARNRSTKSETRTLLTKALFSIDGDASEAEAAVKSAVSALDRAAQKGVIHKNAAARSKSRILKRYNLAVAGAVASAAASAGAPKEDAKPAARRRAATPKSEEPKPRTPRSRSNK